MQCAIILIPLLGTSLGAAAVFFMGKTQNPVAERLLMGFAAGVMVSASVWSLLLPAVEMAKERGNPPWIPAVAGFAAGIVFLLAVDCLKAPTGDMMMFVVTLHNVPEGMAVGVACVGAMSRDTGITFAGAMALSIGIAIQNIPEGAIISMPLKNKGMGKKKAFLCGTLSGAVEPLGAFLTILVTARVVFLLPYLLAFAAGAMFYVVIGELLPEAQTGGPKKTDTLGAAAGFLLMMALDLAL